MKTASIKFGSRAHKVIRFAYVAVIAVLSVFALLTYRELQRQRSAPVILPSYGFYIVDMPEKASLVHAHGTWYVVNGPTPAETLQTTTIECRKARLQCVESTSVVSVSEQGFLDSIPAAFEVERWTDDEIVTKPETGQQRDRRHPRRREMQGAAAHAQARRWCEGALRRDGQGEIARTRWQVPRLGRQAVSASDSCLRFRRGPQRKARAKRQHRRPKSAPYTTQSRRRFRAARMAFVLLETPEDNIRRAASPPGRIKSEDRARFDAICKMATGPDGAQLHANANGVTIGQIDPGGEMWRCPARQRADCVPVTVHQSVCKPCRKPFSQFNSSRFPKWSVT
jgi:hypothetical protein